MEQAFQYYLNEVVAYVGGMPVRRRDSMTAAKVDIARGYFEAGWRGGYSEGAEYGYEDGYSTACRDCDEVCE